jgi:uncharacterized protein (TIGR02611 family)
MVPKWFRKAAAAVLGLPLLVLGIILIPLPGPGLVVCFVALLILSSEFEWANKYYDKAKKGIAKIWNESQERQQRYLDKLEKKEKK